MIINDEATHFEGKAVHFRPPCSPGGGAGGHVAKFAGGDLLSHQEERLVKELRHLPSGTPSSAIQGQACQRSDLSDHHGDDEWSLPPQGCLKPSRV